VVFCVCVCVCEGFSRNVTAPSQITNRRSSGRFEASQTSRQKPFADASRESPKLLRQDEKREKGKRKNTKQARIKNETENKTKRIYEKSIKLTFVPSFFFFFGLFAIQEERAERMRKKKEKRRKMLQITIHVIVG